MKEPGRGSLFVLPITEFCLERAQVACSELDLDPALCLESGSWPSAP